MSSFVTLESKDPDSLNKDYVVDLAPLRNGQLGAASDYLETGELIATIDSVTATDSALTIESSSLINASSSIQIITSGGTFNQYTEVTVRFTTDSTPARTDERTFRIFITER